MLQRAASNAYSWWWASHIRTKQSKWLEQNLQDMGEKVQAVLKLIEEDGDSFARRAEMYYKKRPELIHFVEESYRAYRALAERYDHISTELQNANNTIAYVFPEQVQFAMDEDEDENSPRVQRKPQEGSKGGGNIPNVPNIPKELKGMLATAKKKFQPEKPKKGDALEVSKSGLSKAEGLLEIDKLQKQILALQTEKEFAKSSYEGGLVKYWEMEEQIRDLQDKLCSLQDEFGDGIVIEDGEARSLMASAALKSCHESLAQLQEKQERFAQEAIIEQKRIHKTRERFNSLKIELEIDQDELQVKNESKTAASDTNNSNQEPGESTQQTRDLDLLRDKIKEHFEVGFSGSLTVTELAEKIEELVNKVISLESAVSSQNALIQTLRMETDDLQAQIQTLEGEKSTLINGKNDLSDKMREMEQKLQGVHDLNQNIQDQNINLQTHFTEAHCNLDHLSEKLHSVKSNEELLASAQSEGSFVAVDTVSQDGTEVSQLQVQESVLKPDNSIQKSTSMKELKVSDSSKFSSSTDNKGQNHQSIMLRDNKAAVKETSEVQTRNDPDVSSENCRDSNLDGKGSKRASKKLISFLLAEPQEQEGNGDDQPDWKQLFMRGMENRELVLLSEYTIVLQNYNELKKKLDESEKRSGDCNSHFDMMVQLKELKSANTKKDEQIWLLHQKLSLLQPGEEEDNEHEKSTIAESPSTEKETADDVKEVLVDQPESNTAIEEKFRSNIDEVLEENLNFWLRFSATFHQIQKFDTEVKDLQSELLKIEKKQSKQEGNSSAKYSLQSDAKALYKHLREVQTELTVWLEKSILLKDELKGRFSCLCDIQDEITAALKESAEDNEFKFTSYQAAKFQGEILNMKQENNKVSDELQAGLDHVTALQLEVEKTLARLNEEFKLSGSKHKQNVSQQNSENRSRIPLRSFIFGVKPKKHRHSIFSYVHPALHRKYNGL